MSNISATADIETPKFGHAWRDAQGRTHASVYLNGSLIFLVFDSAADARAAITAIAEAAGALDRMEADPTLDKVRSGE